MKSEVSLRFVLAIAPTIAIAAPNQNTIHQSSPKEVTSVPTANATVAPKVTKTTSEATTQ
ncbi:hypothetical protein KNCP2_09480 [Candidatus Rickettsia kedanie]|uniref:Uncharacterized protein n=1 Tax=Candidatus Rickettsia kedanie TaxID=3115352 RepID=A0ABP9TY40_9RICK